MENYRIIYFGGVNCPACVLVKKELAKLEGCDIEEYDMAENIDKAVENGVMNIPTTILLKGDTEVYRHLGSISADQIYEKFAE